MMNLPMWAVHKARIRTKRAVEMFAERTLAPGDYESVIQDVVGFGAVIFRMGERTRGSYTASQVYAGKKNRLVGFTEANVL